MRKHLPLLLLLAPLLSWTACDTKYDANGHLDGMWQMLQWRDKETAQVVADKHTGLYYCFQLRLMKFARRGSPANYHLAYFTHTGDSLVLGKIVHYPTDSLCTPAVLAPFGVPADGRFRVEALSSERMVLSTPNAELTFRKY